MSTQNDRPAGIGPVADTEATGWADLCEDVEIEDWLIARRKRQQIEALLWLLASLGVLTFLICIAQIGA